MDMRTVLCILGWLAGGLLFVVMVFLLEFLFDIASLCEPWRILLPLSLAAGYPLVLIALIAEQTTTFLARVFALLVALALLVYGILVPPSSPLILFSSPPDVPFWYRLLRSLILAMPLLLWLRLSVGVRFRTLLKRKRWWRNRITSKTSPDESSTTGHAPGRQQD